MIAPSKDFDLDDALEFLIPRGFPTFDEFKKNPDKYRLGKDHLFESIQNSTTLDRDLLKTQKVYWRYGKEAFSLGKLERVCIENGYTIDMCEMIGFRSKNTSGTGKDEIFVRVFPKHEMKAMGAVVPNT